MKTFKFPKKIFGYLCRRLIMICEKKIVPLAFRIHKVGNNGISTVRFSILSNHFLRTICHISFYHNEIILKFRIRDVQFVSCDYIYFTVTRGPEDCLLHGDKFVTFKDERS